MNRHLGAIAVAVTAASAIALPAAAHHSYAMFDHNKEVELKGATVVDWQWTSPHTWLYVLVPNGSAAPDKYSVEGGNPGLLRREGYEIGSLKAGDKVTVYIAPLKNGAKGGALLAVVLPNGKMLGERLQKGQDLSAASG